MSNPSSGERIIRNASVASRVTKNPKACEECRRKKQKCDGQAPCSMCIKRRSRCAYRAYIRQRGGRVSPNTRDVSDHGAKSDAIHQQSMPPRVHIFNNIRATQDTARRRTELFYGASSPFSVLQHLDTHLPTHESPAAHSDASPEEVQDGGESIRSYNYQGIVFDHLPNPAQQPHSLSRCSYTSAQVALRNFLVTACPRLPFLNPNDLCTTFGKLYKATTHADVDPSERALLVVALGLGALPMFDLPNRQELLAQARTEIQSMTYTINFKAVQATLMMAQFEFEAGSPNICYLHLGSAIRKAFAAGVHRVNTHEAKQTMWALYCHESLLCFKLGRRSDLTEEDIAVPMQGDRSHLSYLVRLCTIVRSASQIYHLDNTVAGDLECAESVHQRLREFAEEIRSDVGLDIGGPIYALSGEALAWHITLSYTYHVTKLLVYRPFLLLCLELKRRGLSDAAGLRNSDLVTPELTDAAETCVQSAQVLVELSKTLFSMQIGVDGVYNHAFYLESACFVLGLAAVHDSGRDSPDCLLERTNTGLQMLRRLGPREPAQSIAAAVEQMINRIRALPVKMTQGTESGYMRPLTATVDQPQRINDDVLVNAATTSAEELSAPVGWENEVLDDLWSVMDWNVGFPNSDPTSFVPTWDFGTQ